MQASRTPEDLMRRVPEIHCALARSVRGCGRATVSVFRLRPIVDELDAPLARSPLHAPRQQIRLVSHPVAGRRESRRSRPEWARRAPARSSRSAPGLPPRPRLAPQARSLPWMFAGQLVATAIGPCASQSNTLWIDATASSTGWASWLLAPGRGIRTATGVVGSGFFWRSWWRARSI